VSRRTWTYPELRRVVAAIESGKTWPAVAAEVGANLDTLRTVVSNHGMRPDLSKRPPREHPAEAKVVRALALRNRERLSWPMIAERVEWGSKPQSLARACRRHIDRHGGKVHAGNPDTRRTKWGTVSTRAPAP